MAAKPSWLTDTQRRTEICTVLSPLSLDELTRLKTILSKPGGRKIVLAACELSINSKKLRQDIKDAVKKVGGRILSTAGQGLRKILS